MPLLKDSKIKSSLESLMQREDPYGFVIFKVKATGKFVQFAGSKAEGLIFDLPAKQLSEVQLQKAINILKPHNIEHETTIIYKDDTETEISNKVSLFSKNLNDDLDLAVELTSRIIIAVFGENANVEIAITTD